MAVNGKAMDPNAGSWTIDPVWDNSRFQLDYLTKPTALMDLGIDINKRKVGERVQDSDEVLIAAYPHFSPSGVYGWVGGRVVWVVGICACRSRVCVVCVGGKRG